MLRRDEEPMETDVLIAGGGIAGLMAAIRAAVSGASVIVAEKANTKRSGCGATGNDHFLCYLPEVHGKDMAPILREYQEQPGRRLLGYFLGCPIPRTVLRPGKGLGQLGHLHETQRALGLFRPRLSGTPAHLAQICRSQSKIGLDPASKETRGSHREPSDDHGGHHGGG